jgi:Cu-processing system permease protein
MVSITIACSSTFSTLATGGVVFGLYGVAFAGSWVEQIGSYMNSTTAVQIGVISSLLMPSEALWRRAAYEMTSPLISVMAGGPFTSRSVPSPLMVAYAGLYLALALFIAIRRFAKRDL